MHGISIIKAKLSSLCIICSFGQVKFSLDKYIMAFYLSLGKYMYYFLLFPHPCINDQNYLSEEQNVCKATICSCLFGLFCRIQVN